MKRRHAFAGALLLSLLAWAAFGSMAWAQVGAELQIERRDTTIIVKQSAPSAEGGEFIASNPTCEEGVTLGVVYAPGSYLVETLVNDTLITSAIALLRRPEGNEEQEKLELVGGSLEINPETLCPENIARSEETDVTILDGRTTIVGTVFLYDNSTGIGTLDGPVTLERIAKEDSPALTATSESLEFNVDEDVTTLIGNVQVISEDRVSEADSLVYNEEAGIAILYGDPARSRMGEDVVEGSIIKYDLDSNDVVVTENVSATFEYQPEDEP